MKVYVTVLNNNENKVEQEREEVNIKRGFVLRREYKTRMKVLNSMKLYVTIM